MQRFIVNLIKINKQMSQQGIDRPPAGSLSPITADKTDNRDHLFQPTPGILDREALQLFKAMDLAG
jgi:hypothetical protein